MKLLDRYILRLFTLNFAILLVVILGLVVMVDLMFQLDEFLDAGRKHAEAYGGPSIWWTLRAIADYYGPTICFVYVYLAGLIVIAAMGFTFSAVSRAGELVAIITSGISLHRVAAPVLVAACVINGLTLLDQELLIPQMADKLTRKAHEIKHTKRRTYALHYAADSKGNLVSAGAFDVMTGDLEGVAILERDASGRAVRRITAESARWDEASHRWLLADGKAHRTGSGDAAPGAVTPADERVEAIDVFATDLSPQVLMARRATIYPALLSMNELGKLMNNPAADRGRILGIMHSRFSLLVVNVLILAMVMPLFLSREPANPLKQAVKGAAIGVGSWMTGIGVAQFAAAALNPVVASWMPVVVFLPVSAWLLARLKT